MSSGASKGKEYGTMKKYGCDVVKQVAFGLGCIGQGQSSPGLGRTGTEKLWHGQCTEDRQVWQQHRWSGREVETDWSVRRSQALQGLSGVC